MTIIVVRSCGLRLRLPAEGAAGAHQGGKPLLTKAQVRRRVGGMRGVVSPRCRLRRPRPRCRARRFRDVRIVPDGRRGDRNAPARTHPAVASYPPVRCAGRRRAHRYDRRRGRPEGKYRWPRPSDLEEIMAEGRGVRGATAKRTSCAIEQPAAQLSVGTVSAAAPMRSAARRRRSGGCAWRDAGRRMAARRRCDSGIDEVLRAMLRGRWTSGGDPQQGSSQRLLPTKLSVVELVFDAWSCSPPTARER